MRLLVQRVKEASVKVEHKICGKIGIGLLVFVGMRHNDTVENAKWLAQKLVGLRIFRDEEDKMNLSVQDVQGKLLVISQFTLYGDCSKGRRPAFTGAALPEEALALYEKFISLLEKEMGHPVQTGIFGAPMEVSLINDGPVTFLIEH